MSELKHTNNDDLRNKNEACIGRLFDSMEGAFFESIKSPLFRDTLMGLVLDGFDWDKMKALPSMPVKSVRFTNNILKIAKQKGRALTSHDFNMDANGARKFNFSLGFMAKCVDLFRRELEHHKLKAPTSADASNTGPYVYDSFVKACLDDSFEGSIPNESSCVGFIQNKIDLVDNAYQVYQDVSVELFENNEGFIKGLASEFANSTSAYIDRHDMAQEASLLIYRKLLKYDPDRGNFFTFLRQILHGHFVNKTARHKTEDRFNKKPEFIAGFETSEDDLLDEVGDGIDAGLMLSALRLIDEDSAQVLRLRYGIGQDGAMTLKEVADTLGVSTTNLRERVLPAATDQLKGALGLGF